MYQGDGVPVGSRTPPPPSGLPNLRPRGTLVFSPDGGAHNVDLFGAFGGLCVCQYLLTLIFFFPSWSVADKLFTRNPSPRAAEVGI